MKKYLSLMILLIASLAKAQVSQIDTSKVNELKDVVITGQYEAQQLKNSVYQVRTINAEEIRSRNASNVQQILNTELGFRFSNDLTLGTSDVQIMGMSGRNVKILLDGIPMVDRSDTRESLNQIDVNTIERIEIVEGPMSVIYGSDALAGVINIITKKPEKSSLELHARLQEETAGREYEAFQGKGNHHQNVGINWRNKGWSALVGFSHNDFGGWNLADKAATIAEVEAIPNRWKPKEQWLGNTKIGFRNKTLGIWYRLDGLKEDITARGGMNPNSYKAKFQNYITHRYTQQLQSDYKWSDQLQLNAVLGYTYLERATRTIIHDFTNNTATLTTAAGEQDQAKFNATIFRATALYTPDKIISVQPGIEFNRDEAAGARINGKPVIQDYAAFISAEFKPHSTINIRPGIRFIHNSVYDAPPVIPSLNSKFSISPAIDFRLAYARGFRSPALRELYYNFIDASHTIIGNPNLKAEASDSFNGSISWVANTKAVYFKSVIGGFYNLFKNRIDYGADAINPSVTTLININRYKTTGLTVENSIRYRNLQASLGFSYIGRYNLLSENEIISIPDFGWATEVTTSLIYAFPKLQANISLFYKYTGSLPSYQLVTTNNNLMAKLVKVGDFNWADLMMNKNFGHHFTVNAGVKNLFNVTQLTNSATATGGAHNNGGAAIPYSYGRSCVLGFIYHLNI